MLKGVDLSKYQGVVDFDALKAAVDFVIIKASFGAPDPGQTPAQYADNQFTRNRDEARRVGLLRGFYHYSYPEYNSAEAEAQCFHDVVGIPQDGEILVLDYESNWSGDKVDWCRRFLDHLSSLYNGYKPLVYLNLATTKAANWTPVISGNYGLWLAQWDFNPGAPMNPNTPWPFLALRQYSDKENIAGLNPVDGDVFYGDATMFQRYGYHAPLPLPTPPVAPIITENPPMTPTAPNPMPQPPVAPPIDIPPASTPTPPPFLKGYRTIIFAVLLALLGMFQNYLVANNVLSPEVTTTLLGLLGVLTVYFRTQA